MNPLHVRRCRYLPPAVDNRQPDGRLCAMEGGRDVPFAIQRVYHLSGLRGDLPRGLHAHRELRQAMYCLAGAFTLELDDGRERQTVALDAFSPGILLEPLLWHVMRDFSPDCVILVLASAPFAEADYIRDYAEFLRLA